MLKAILLNDTSYDDHHGCQIVVNQIHRFAAAAGIRVIWSSPVRNDWRNDHGLLRAAQKADVCIVNGEGTLHDDAPAARQLVEAARFFSGQGLPCVLINALWQNNPGLVPALSIFRQLYVRDSRSAAEMRAGGVTATVVPDLTLAMSYPRRQGSRSGLLLNGSVLDDVQIEAVDAVQQHAGLGYLSIRTFTPLRFARHHRAYFVLALRQFWKQFRHWISSYLRGYAGPLSGKAIGRFRWRHACLRRQAFLTRVSRAEGVITGRFHMVTLCLVTGTPFFALRSNSHKIEALLEPLGMLNRLYDSYEQAVAHRSELPFSQAELARVERFTAAAREQAAEMFRAIAESAGASGGA